MLVQMKSDATSSVSIYKEYFTLTQKYREEYGKKVVVLLQVGAFFEIYGIKNDNDEINGSNISEVCEICQLNISEKKIQYDNGGVLMAGFRDYTVDKYLSRLTDYGYTIPVYIQEKEGNVVKRVLDRVYSPGTLISCDTDTSPVMTNNIMCIWMETYKPTIRKGKTKSNIRDTIIYGISVVNIFTGKSYIFQYETTFYMNTTTFDELERYISVYSPSEIVMITPFDDSDLDKIIQYSGIRSTSIHRVSNGEDISIKVKRCGEQRYIKQILTTFFKEDTYDVCSEFQTDTIATQSFCYLLDFIQEHNSELVRKISIPQFNNTTDRMILANHTLKQLNIIDDNIMESKQYGTLSSVLNLLNKCSTPMGKRSFQYKLTNPVFDVEWLNLEYSMTEQFLSDDNYSLVDNFRKQMKQIRDMEKICRQLVVKKIYPSSIYQLYNGIKIIQQLNVCLYELPDICEYLIKGIIGLHSGIDPNTYIEQESQSIINFLETHFILEECKNISSMSSFSQNIIESGISEELDELIIEKNNCVGEFNRIFIYLNNLMKENEKKSDIDYIKLHETEKSGTFVQITQKRSVLLKQYMIKYEKENNDGDYPIKSDDIKFTKASSSNMNIESLRLNEVIRKNVEYKDKINNTISKVYLQVLSELVREHFESLECLSEYIAKLDVIICKAYIAKTYNYCKPEINEKAEKSYVDACDLRHCLIEHIQQNELYVTNDICIGKENNKKTTNGILLYGTNAVGKTSLIRALGISIVLAQSGIYVPCSSFTYKPYTAIFSRILGNDNIFKGLSTFAVEMSELRVILKMADKNSLVLGDELCSGTEMESALSIFVAGLSKLHKNKSSFIFATHFHEIIDFEEIKKLKNLYCYHMAVTFDRELDILIYDRKLREGSGPRTYGLEVCKSLYLEEDFMKEAYKIRNKYYPNECGELSNKITKYNAKKIKGKCEMCKETLGEEIHHINQQKDANSDGFIGSFHKNHPANLMSICEKCHDNIHSKEPLENTMIIRRKTTNGYMLKEDTKKNKDIYASI
jgi:DNA mismatch repair protein MutS